MKLLIKPYIGVGKINFGMNQEEIQDILKEQPRRFKKFEDDEYETDAYKLFYVYYKSSGVCEAIEFFSPAKIKFDDIFLLELPYKEIEEYFFNKDENIEIEDTGFTSYKYGVGIYAPYALIEPLEKPEGIIVFDKNYY